MITMARDGNSISLEPSAVNAGYNFFDNSDLDVAVGNDKHIYNKSNPVNIDGVLHTLHERASSQTEHNFRSNEGLEFRREHVDLKNKYNLN